METGVENAAEDLNSALFLRAILNRFLCLVYMSLLYRWNSWALANMREKHCAMSRVLVPGNLMMLESVPRCVYQGPQTSEVWAATPLLTVNPDPLPVSVRKQSTR